MKRVPPSLACVVFAALGLLVGCSGEVAGERPPHPPALGPVRGFVENHGQWDAGLRFAAAIGTRWTMVGGGTLSFGDGANTLRLSPSSRCVTTTRGVDTIATRCHFLRGRDPAQWVEDVPVFGAVAIDGIAPGVSLLLRESHDGHGFAYDLALSPGADATALEFKVGGARALRLDATSGELVLDCGTVELRQSAPLAWSLGVAGTRSPVPCRFELRGEDRFGFRLEVANAAAEHVIDPDLRWATHLGGTRLDEGFAVDVAANGDVFIAGSTLSPDLPTTPTVFDPGYNGTHPTPRDIGDAFVARLAADDGRLLWVTYLGGVENDRLASVAAIGDDAMLTGWTTSLDFPVTPGAFDTSHNGTGDGYLYLGGDVFVTRLADDGRSLRWSSFLGGSALEYPTSMAVRRNGEVAVSGHVHSTNFPTTPGAYSATRRAFSDLFLTRFAPDGASLLGSTYFGGADGEEYPHAMAFDAQGGVVLAGATDSNDLPVTPGALDTSFNGGVDHLADGFVARFDDRATTLSWCTYLGTPSSEYPRGIAIESNGDLTLTGAIDGPGLPTTPGVVGPNHFGGKDGFVWRISGDGATTRWASYVGGSLDDVFERCVALGGGRIAVSGNSLSPEFPRTRGAMNPVPLGQADGVVVVLAGDGTSIDHATSIGGRFYDRGLDVKRTADGELVTTGATYSFDSPVTQNGLAYRAGGDAFCQRLTALPLGVTRVGVPSGACARDARILARSAPFVGEARFQLSAGDVPPASPTLALVSLGTLTTPQSLFGIELFVDPAAILMSLPVAVDPHGSALMPLALPASPGLAGATIAVQFAWLDACPGAMLGASDAVRVVIQP
jgi:hypothetical protein